MTAPAIVWFRNDLRLADHPALAAAVAAGRPVLPVYILDEVTPGGWAAGAASRWWLHHSLVALSAALESLGSRLVLRRGAAADCLAGLAQDVGAAALYWNRHYEPWDATLEAELERRLGDRLELAPQPGNLLFAPGAIRTGAGKPFQVFTPFWKACLAAPEPATPLAAPDRLGPLPASVASSRLGDWAMLPVRPDWAGGLRERWQPGEAGAWTRLAGFLDGAVNRYREQRDRPDIAGTSGLSPHLHHGEISPRQVWHAVRQRVAGGGASEGDAAAFLRELGWREFSMHLLQHFPQLPESPLRAEFARFPWHRDPELLAAWQRGQTGYPIVDAGMRELWHTGWMHNRVRMIVASMLVKDFLIDWQHGEAWFWDTLVDADLAANAASWQWVAGCGADAAPYFRIFNPVLQGRKFDPEGEYVRRWVPELARLPAAAIHAPWQASAGVLAAGGVRLGADYPEPVVDHGAARARALAAYADLRGQRSAV